MNQKQKQLKELEAIAQVSLDRELDKLASIKSELQDIDDELSDMARRAEARLASLANSAGGDIALSLGMDSRWAQWTKQERLRLLRSKAGIAIRKEVQFAETQKAFGKVEALKALSRREAGRSR